MVYEGLSSEAAFFWFLFALFFIALGLFGIFLGIDFHEEWHNKRGSGKITRAV
jgi:hypothetical protein